MGLFYEVLSAINNPNQQASVGQLGSIMNTVQQASAGHGLDASALQSIASLAGNYLRPALQQQGATAGAGNLLGGLMGQVAGTNPSLAALNSFLPPQLQQQMIQGIAQKTGLNATVIAGILPTLIPAVLGLLNMGAPKPGAQGSNPLLGAFLDSDRDGDTDLGDVLKFAGRFLNPPQ